MLGTAMASAGRKTWRTYSPGSSEKWTQSVMRAGKIPAPPGTSVSHWMSRSASQNEGVARQAMETTRMTWSGQRSRYSAATTPRIAATMIATARPMRVSWRVMGKASEMSRLMSTPVKLCPRSPWTRPTR